ncbi:RNA recognition motif domain-containing protein [Nitrospira sp. Nam74]
MPYRIFIDPLPRDFTSTDLAALLQPFGGVLSAEVAYDSLGYSLRFGHAGMRTEEAANNVVKQLDGRVFHNAPLTLVRTEDGGGAFWDQPAVHRLAS